MDPKEVVDESECGWQTRAWYVFLHRWLPVFCRWWDDSTIPILLPTTAMAMMACLDRRSTSGSISPIFVSLFCCFSPGLAGYSKVHLLTQTSVSRQIVSRDVVMIAEHYMEKRQPLHHLRTDHHHHHATRQNIQQPTNSSQISLSDLKVCTCERHQHHLL